MYQTFAYFPIKIALSGFFKEDFKTSFKRYEP